MPRSDFRFIVFGVQLDKESPEYDHLVENHTDHLNTAAILWDIMSCADYVARVWDTQQNGFVTRACLEAELNKI